MNKVILMGRLTKDAELRYTANTNAAVASFTVAVDRKFKQEGQPTADFINCVAWGKTAEFVNNYFKKGHRIALTGRMQTRTWDDAENKRHYITEVIVDEVEFAESKREDYSGDAYARPQFQPPVPANMAPAPADIAPTPADAGPAPVAEGYFPIDDDGEIPF